MNPPSSIASRQELLSFIENTSEENLPRLLQLVRDFQKETVANQILGIEKIDTSQLQWQQAVNRIDLQMQGGVDRRTAQISMLFTEFDEDSDIEEQQKTLETICTIEGLSI
jgi:hypothetical protein